MSMIYVNICFLGLIIAGTMMYVNIHLLSRFHHC